LVLRRRPDIPAEASCGLPTVAVRLPRHPAARALIRAAGVPIAAPSANLAGRPSPTAARHVAYDLAGRIPLILDGGPARVGLESTVVDCTRSPPRLLRPGGVSLEELRRIVPGIRAVRGTAHRPACPGMKYRHYAPAVPLVLGPPAALARLARQEAGKGRAVAVLSSSESARSFPASTDVHIMGSRAEPREWAARLFGTLRTLEKTADIILVEAIPARGLGRAVRDRLRKAASLAP
jgi:L-threonylcarbamoyladenylate synthase